LKFNDAINNVKSERKRKPKVDKVTPQVNLRKGAHSLYTNETPLVAEMRNRVESNYTTRSGEM